MGGRRLVVFGRRGAVWRFRLGLLLHLRRHGRCIVIMIVIVIRRRCRRIMTGWRCWCGKVVVFLKFMRVGLWILRRGPTVAGLRILLLDRLRKIVPVRN